MRKNQRKISQVRKNSHQLFLEAKRRFQYRPLNRRNDTKNSDKIHSPECSSVTQNNKQENSNDISWLDKMVSNFDIKDHESTQKTLQKQQALQANEGQPTKNQYHNQQTKPLYFIKKRAVLAEQNLNKSNSKPVIKRSLQKVTERKSATKIQRSIAAKRNTVDIPQQREEKDVFDVDIQDCPQLFPSKRGESSPIKQFTKESSKKDDICTIIKKLQTQPIIDVEVTVLKVEQPSFEEIQKLQSTGNFRQNVIYPTPQLSPEKVPARLQQQPRQVTGKIRRNAVVRQRQKASVTVQQIRVTPPVTMVPPLNKAKLRSNGLNFYQQPIQQQEQQRTCQTSRKLQQKFGQIFCELDGCKQGQIDRQNCYSENINDDIRYLIGPIISKIKYQDKKYHLQHFIDQGKKIISALQAHQISKLLKCSVTNRLFFLDTKRSETGRTTQRNHLNDRHSSSLLMRSYNKSDLTEEVPIKKQQSTEQFRYYPGKNVSDEFNQRRQKLKQLKSQILQRDRVNQININNYETYEKSPRGVQALQKTRTKSAIRTQSNSISRDPYLLRVSAGRSLQKLISEQRQQYARLPERFAEWHSPQPTPSRQAYLERKSRSPKIQTVQLQKSLYLDNKTNEKSVYIDKLNQKSIIHEPEGPMKQVDLQDQKYFLERDECNRIDLLNQRLSKYIQQNHLKQARVANISLEFAELRKHLRN